MANISSTLEELESNIDNFQFQLNRPLCHLIDAVRSKYIINAFNKYSLLENVKEKSNILRNELSEKFDNYRSTGHLIAFDFDTEKKRDKFVRDAYQNNLLVNPTNDKSIRIRPNLAFSDDELDKLLSTVSVIEK